MGHATTRGRWRRGAAIVVATLLAAPATTYAAPPCEPDQPRARYISQTKAVIEGAIVDDRGRLYLTDLLRGRVLRVDRPGARPTVIATLPDRFGAGALAFTPDGRLLVGTGADARVFLGDRLLPGGISEVDVETGQLTPIASGFSAANGMDVAGDGTIYVTNDFGVSIGRVTPDGRADPRWGRLASANGAVLNADDTYLYVSRSFQKPGVSRIPVDRPGEPENLLTFRGRDLFSAPDGLTLDSADRPIVPLNTGGEVLRIDAPGRACSLVRGLTLTSVVVYGRGDTGFSRGRLYRAGFDGVIAEIPGGFDPGA